MTLLSSLLLRPCSLYIYQSKGMCSILLTVNRLPISLIVVRNADEYVYMYIYDQTNDWFSGSCTLSVFIVQIPNPLFDLAGITCGHFLIPFWTFFGATLIGKAVFKMLIQVSAYYSALSHYSEYVCTLYS